MSDLGEDLEFSLLDQPRFLQTWYDLKSEIDLTEIELAAHDQAAKDLRAKLNAKRQLAHRLMEYCKHTDVLGHSMLWGTKPGWQRCKICHTNFDHNPDPTLDEIRAAEHS